MEKKIVFLTNTPVPYQLDLFSQLHKYTPVNMLLASANNSGQNVAWKLNLPEWTATLPDAKTSKQYNILTQYLNPQTTKYIICGGYKTPYAKALKKWAKRHNILFYYWLERPQPHAGIKAIIRNFCLARALKNADGVWGIDSQAVEVYKKYNTNVSQLPYAISGFGKLAKRDYKKPIKCLYIGQYIPRKGIDILLETFRDINPSQAQLTFAGKGIQEDEINIFCAQTGHKNQGFVQPHSLPQLLKDHDVFVFPSRYDGWGVVVAEAMAAGLPVLTSHKVGASDLLNETCGAILPLEVEAFKVTLQNYIKNTDILAKHSQNAYKNWELSKANTSEAIQFLLKPIS